MDAQAGRHYRGAIQGVLPRALPHERRAAVLDPPEHRLPVPPDGHPLFPEDTQQLRDSEEQDTALFEPGLRDRPGRRHRARIPDAAARRDRLAGHSAERVAELPAERCQREEDLELHHPQGRRPAAGAVQHDAPGLRVEMGRPEDLYPVRHPHRREVRREGAGFHALEERRGQVFHAQGVSREGKGEPDRQEQDRRAALCGRPRGKTHVPRSRQGQGLRRAADGRPAGQPLCQLVRVEKQGDAFRARGQRCDRQAHPEGGQHQDVAHRSAAGVVAPGIREPDAQGRKDTLQHFVRGDVARRGARGDYAERIHAPYEGDGRSGRRGHEPVLRADARQLHHRGERQPPHRRGHPLRCREGLRRQAEVHHQEDRRGRGRGKPLRGGYQGQERGGAYPRREIHARGVVEEGRHAAR